jgi:hypothetical protein
VDPARTEERVNPTPSEALDIVKALAAGAVPAHGLHHFATGLDRLVAAIEEELDYVSGEQGRGASKWIRGEYGSGKTFATRLLCARARARRFATAEVQISVNDTPLHRLETVYRRLVERITTDADGTGAFRAIVDGWLYVVGDEVRRLRGLSEDDPQFADAVDERLEVKLAAISTQNAAFGQVLRAYHRALVANDLPLAHGLLAWVSGQPNVDRSIISRAGVRGSVDGAAALSFLRGLLLVLRQSGHAGLTVVLDEVETIQRLKADSREKSLNALRQLVDALAGGELPGLYLVVTGTPDFFDGYKGLKALQPLAQRVATRFDAEDRFDNLRAPQVRLPQFDEARLGEVGRKVRDLFPGRDAERVRSTVDDAFIETLVGSVTTGFGGRVSVAPRIFLRELVDVLDRVDQHPDYDPRARYRLEIKDDDLRPEELAARRGSNYEPPEVDEEPPPTGSGRLEG